MASNAKYGFKETFEWPEFPGKWEVPKKRKKKKRGRKLSPPRNANDTEELYDLVPRASGGPNRKIMEKYYLNENSRAADWLNALLPLTPRDNLETIESVDVKGDKKIKFLVANWTSYTNKKARIVNAGEWGHQFLGNGWI